MRQEDLEILSEQNNFSKGVKSKILKDYLGDKKNKPVLVAKGSVK